MRTINCRRILLLAVSTILFWHASGQNKPVAYVNVFTGTSNSRWMMFPGATMPFGMVKLSPDNQGNVWNGGYEYTISSISGFSFLHAMSLSGLSVMPFTGNTSANEGWTKSFAGPADGPFGGMWTAGYRSRFKKETEKGSPGYYGVDLLDAGVRAELTSTIRCGVMRFTYPQTSSAHLVLNFDFATEEKTQVLEAFFEKVSATEMQGYIKQQNGYAGVYTVYFVMQLNKAVESADSWQAEAYTGKEDNYGTAWRSTGKTERNIISFKGKSNSGVILNFSTFKGEKVVMRTGISFVSLQQARLNLTTEMQPFGFGFDAVVQANKAAWNTLLANIEVDGHQPDKEKFYTNLYRCYTGKSIMNDADGKYMDACHNLQQLPDGQQVYSSDGLWGTQWNLTPLWTLLNPGIAESWVKSLLELADKGGWIPEAPVALGYSPIMGSQHQNSLIISAYQKGIRGFDADKAFVHILHDYTAQGEAYPCGGFAGNRLLTDYQAKGYVPDEAGAASNTLEYAYDDWCFAQFAKALGKQGVYDTFMQRSNNYKNTFDTSTKFMRRRHADGSWVTPFDAFKYGTEGGWNGKGFMEGNAYQYSFFVPQDIPALIHLMGRDTFVTRLRNGFDNNLFDLGNQPCLATPFLFNYAGMPWLTQCYTRNIVDSMYNTSPYQGWVGEEDEGQMSANFVLLAMGLFETDGGCSTPPYYDITSPLFTKAVIHLDEKYYPGKTFTIEAVNNSAANRYIQSAMLNGKPLLKPMLTHKDIVKGGKLVLVMGRMPNKNCFIP